MNFKFIIFCSALLLAALVLENIFHMNGTTSSTQSNNIERKILKDKKFVTIGDVHGQIKKLKPLWKKLEAHLGEKMSEYTFVFMGDYVDRGAEVKETIDFLIDLQQKYKVYCLMGNHDHALSMFLGLFQDKFPSGFDISSTSKGSWDNKLWENASGEHNLMHLQGRRYGGVSSTYNASSTFRSYGCTFGDRDAMIKNVPESHKNFFRNLPWVLESEDYIFVHAGLVSTEPLKKQLDILYNKDVTIPRVLQLSDRHLFPAHPEDSRTIVSGHVTFSQVRFTEKRIMCDTSGGKFGPLSAVILPEEEVISANDY